MKTNNLKWLVGYTMPNCEKKLEVILKRTGVECYLPTHKVVRQWSDRKKTIDVPLFPNYIFIYTNSTKRWEHLKHSELVKFLVVDGKPAEIKHEEIELIKMLQSNGNNITIETPKHKYSIGMKVTITGGNFKGISGTILKENKNSVMIELEGLRQVLVIKVEPSQITDESELCLK